MAASSHASTVDHALAWVMPPATTQQWLVILPVALCLIAGAGLMMLRHQIRIHPPIAIATLALLTVIDALLLWRVSVDGPITMMMGRWLPPFGIAFTVDLTGALFALAAAIVSLSGAVYALGDINGSGRRYGFYPFLLVLTAGVTGAFLTGDIFNLYVWFEVLLISSFGLLILGSEREQIDGALKYAILNLIGTTLFLIAVGYLYAIFGTLNMADIARKAGGLRDHAPLMTLATLFVLAFGMKAAAFPVNFWLPASYHTPRVVVSALFAGLLTKVGIYALLRVMVMLLPVERDTLSLVIGLAAALSMLLGALGALAQRDVRRFMGFIIIVGIGYIAAGAAIGGVAGVSAAIFYALHSIVLMTALYLVAGEMRARAGSFRLDELGGLWRVAPVFSAVALALFFAGSGLPPFSGFWPKAMLVKASIDIGAWWLAAAILISGFLITMAFGRLFLLAFWRPHPLAQDNPDAVVASPHGASEDLLRLAPIIVLTALVVVFGIFPEQLLQLCQRAAEGLSDPTAYIQSVFGQGGTP
ncbi:Na+/H+ antiporter subunit D [Rhizobium halophytocola]|uniref:Multicomponent Na+:H+ antiporter subunit D n=1 Tax=Rhizobium halophytocola TaxID=735519 RepID=A0ABS4E5W4_9HYPH|nr:Na+/H+ antiporter subunit D [Rhizobium halophytocola]MBP1853298.1 multicomponent Na+:H+ antiporter subunit D [Rhizobium halophytocola]